ncbi:MAG: hypothetical protein JWQ98_3703 [Chlorobi bacterium]|nr:hypothetical protein [Chlorobiota bacterium]
MTDPDFPTQVKLIHRSRAERGPDTMLINRKDDFEYTSIKLLLQVCK